MSDRYVASLIAQRHSKHVTVISLWGVHTWLQPDLVLFRDSVYQSASNLESRQYLWLQRWSWILENIILEDYMHPKVPPLDMHGNCASVRDWTRLRTS